MSLGVVSYMEASMSRSNAGDLPMAERKRRTRQLQLVLQCAGPGSVTGSHSTQCRREGRPHGGYKGLSSQYPLPRSGFDSQEFMEEVKNNVNAEYKEEQRNRNNSPHWLPAANKEKNHTGEQPLILQSFLAPNKQEQVDGVLPATTPSCKRPISSAGRKYRDDPDYFCRGNSTHQYLTATELPGQSVRLVDLTLGRPTRTSLLRVRQRTKSAPGVRAVVEVKSHLHKQQYLAAKTEDRYKNIDVPHDLLPVTENHETVHQFLIGARYNRMYHHDAKCLHKLGLFVSRQDPLHCYKMNVPGHKGQLSHATDLHGSISSLSLSSESLGSEADQTDMTAGGSVYLSRKPAWSNTGEEEDQLMTARGTTVRSSTPAPSPSPASRSRETFAHKGRQKPKVKLLGGQTLGSHESNDGGHEDCILCKRQEPAKHHQCFAPGSHFAHSRQARPSEEDSDWNHNKDHMQLQQYHLRIMGIKFGVKSGPQAPPRSNLLYTTRTDAHFTQPSSTRQAKQASGGAGSLHYGGAGKKTRPTTIPADNSKPEGSTSSKISVIISAHGDEDSTHQTAAGEDIPREKAASEDKDLAIDKLLTAESNNMCGVSDESKQEDLEDTRLDDKEAGTYEGTYSNVLTGDAEDPNMEPDNLTQQDTQIGAGQECSKATLGSLESAAAVDRFSMNGEPVDRNESEDKKTASNSSIATDVGGDATTNAQCTGNESSPEKESQEDCLAEDNPDISACLSVSDPAAEEVCKETENPTVDDTS